MTALVDMLIRHEDEMLKVYRCPAGKWSIGVGRNLEGKGITVEESRYLLANDIAECEDDLSGFEWWSGLDGIRKDCLIDMRFNLGPGGFRGFRKMIDAIGVGNYEEAADQMLDSAWAMQVGDRAVELAYMMRTGRYANHVSG